MVTDACRQGVTSWEQTPSQREVVHFSLTFKISGYPILIDLTPQPPKRREKFYGLKYNHTVSKLTDTDHGVIQARESGQSAFRVIDPISTNGG